MTSYEHVITYAGHILWLIVKRRWMLNVVCGCGDIDRNLSVSKNKYKPDFYV